jgi:tetratricopeptide (TPR) repeat protein
MHSTPDPVAEEIFLAASDIGWMEAVTNEERYLLVGIKSLNACERGGFAYGSAEVASALGVGFDIYGWHGLAERYYRLAADYSQQIDPPQPLYQLEHSLAFHYNLCANAEKSLEHALHAVEIAQSTGDLRRLGSAMHLVTWAQYFQGRLAEAVETSEEIIAIGEEGSDRQLICWGLFGLGAAQKRLGQIVKAITSLQRAIEAAKEVPDYYTQAGAGSWLARCHLAKGELEQAIQVAETSHELLLEHKIWLNKPYTNAGLSETYLMAAGNSTGKARQVWLKKARGAA